MSQHLDLVRAAAAGVWPLCEAVTESKSSADDTMPLPRLCLTRVPNRIPSLAALLISHEPIASTYPRWLPVRKFCTRSSKTPRPSSPVISTVLRLRLASSCTLMVSSLAFCCASARRAASRSFSTSFFAAWRQQGDQQDGLSEKPASLQK